MSKRFRASTGLATSADETANKTHKHTMTYYETAEDITITRDRALEELTNHGVDVNSDEILLFNLEMGDKDTYEAQEVLAWLGY